MKRIACCLLLGLLSVPAPAENRVLRLAHGLDRSHPVHKAMVFMAERAQEKSHGSLKIFIYPSEQLGNEKECIEGLQLGYLSMTKTSTASMEAFVPELKVFSMPYLFRDSEHFWKVCQGEIGKSLLVAGQAKGLRGLCYYDAGARSFYAKKPILKPSDLCADGMTLKVRVLPSQIVREMVSTMGGAPTPISWGELYTSLDQGVVDAAENNPPSLLSSRHYEICRYYSLDEHTRIPDMLVLSSRVWQSLSEEHQRILQEAVDESVEYQKQLWREGEEYAMKVVQEDGVEVFRPDKEPFRKAVEPMMKKYEESSLGDLIRKIREVK